MFPGELGQGHGDVVVVLQVDGLHAVKRHISQHHQVLTHSVDAIHCSACVNKWTNERTNERMK